MGNRNPTKRREKMGEKIFETTMAEIFPNLVKNIYRYQKMSKTEEISKSILCLSTL